MMRLNVKAFATACGLIWGGGVLAFTWWRMLFGDHGEDDTFFSKLYRGYRITPIGSLIGLAWGLADGFAGGVVFAWLYNTIADRMPVKIEI